MMSNKFYFFTKRVLCIFQDKSSKKIIFLSGNNGKLLANS